MYYRYVNHERDAIWSLDSNSSTQRDIHLRSGNSSQFSGAIEHAGLGLSTNPLYLSGGPYSGENINTTILNSTTNNIDVRMDGTLRLNDPYYTTNVDTNVRIWAASNRTGSRRLECGICEILIFANNSTSTAEKAEGYLAHKWGMTNLLPNSHSYKNSPP